LGFVGVPGTLSSRRGLALMAGTRAVHRDAGNDQGDARQVAYGRTWPKTISPAVVAVTGS
jgi:hypothetical protein